MVRAIQHDRASWRSRGQKPRARVLENVHSEEGARGTAHARFEK